MSHHDTLRLTRVVAATLARVWEAWTTEEGLASWWWSHLPDTTYSVDLRPGGSYRIEAPGPGFAVTGEYLRIEEPHQLEMTWVWLDHGQRGDLEQVAVTFIPEDDPSFTRIDIVHTGPWTTPEPAENYLLGWNFTLDQLETTLAGAPGSEPSH
jgi:uncharacterized protein YndB with AHSA1/START domain